MLTALTASGHGYVLTVVDRSFLAVAVPARRVLDGRELPRAIVADLMAAGFTWMSFPPGWVWERHTAGGAS